MQVDLRHIDQSQGRNRVDVGIDLSEFYLSVEWDLLEVPAIRNEEYYSCCTEPYTGELKGQIVICTFEYNFVNPRDENAPRILVRLRIATNNHL